MKNSRWMACLVLFSASCLLAQVSAVISGTVTDQSGAVVPNATVTATNTETGAAREMTADGAGHYQISFAPGWPVRDSRQETGIPTSLSHREFNYL